MRLKIYQNYNQALKAAKEMALADAEHATRHTLIFNNLTLSDTDRDYLVTGSSTKCCCGETGAVEVTYFADPDLCEDVIGGNQFTVRTGYCEYCGNEDPMP